MVIRKAKQYSDRGSIKDLKNQAFAKMDLSAFELRFQKLYKLAQKTNNERMMAALGIITTDYIEDKNALPLTVYRLRKTVEDIKSKSALPFSLVEKPEVSELDRELESKRQKQLERAVFKRVG